MNSNSVLSSQIYRRTLLAVIIFFVGVVQLLLLNWLLEWHLLPDSMDKNGPLWLVSSNTDHNSDNSDSKDPSNANDSSNSAQNTGDHLSALQQDSKKSDIKPAQITPKKKQKNKNERSKNKHIPEKPFFTDTVQGGMELQSPWESVIPQQEWSEQQCKSTMIPKLMQYASDPDRRGRMACMVLSMYPRNRIQMSSIGDSWGQHCDLLFWILDDSDISSDEMINSSMKNENKNESSLSHLQWFEGGFVIRLKLARNPDPVKRNTWEKVHRLYSFMYAMRSQQINQRERMTHLNSKKHDLLLPKNKKRDARLTHDKNDIDWDFQWYLRSDDDVYVNIPRLTQYLRVSEFKPKPQQSSSMKSPPLWFGHTLLDRWRDNNMVYNAGNVHVMNLESLRRLAPIALTLAVAERPGMAAEHCMDFQAGNDDPHLGACMNSVGIYPANTLDYYLRNRFMVFTFRDHRSIESPWKKAIRSRTQSIKNLKQESLNETQVWNVEWFEKDWYWDEKPKLSADKDECCVPINVTFNTHPVINKPELIDKYRMIFKEYSQTFWNNEFDIEKDEKQWDWLCENNMGGGINVFYPRLFVHNLRKKKNGKNSALMMNEETLNAPIIPKGQSISLQIRGLKKTMNNNKNKNDDQSDDDEQRNYVQCFDKDAMNQRCDNSSSYWNTAWHDSSYFHNHGHHTLRELINEHNFYSLWLLSRSSKDLFPDQLLNMNGFSINSRQWKLVDKLL